MRKIRAITATSLFDGHDVSINIFRRLLQNRGVEVIHLGHNRRTSELAFSAIEEGADIVLVSSYQGGHNEYFRHLIDLLKKQQSSHILVFGGGGGVILPSEIKALEAYGVTRIYHADEGQKIGLQGITDDIIKRTQAVIDRRNKELLQKKIDLTKLKTESKREIATLITKFENFSDQKSVKTLSKELKGIKGKTIVIGLTGPGGSGKSSIIDELISRFLKISPDITIGVLAMDPSKAATGGALLGDRIRMNSIFNNRVYMRSLSTRESDTEISPVLKDSINVLKKAGFHLVIVETSGIGQAGHQITKFCDHSIYTMTSEFGAPMQLDKINMLDLADFILINKRSRPGSEDALREVITRYVEERKLKTSHRAMRNLLDLDVPIYATEAGEFNNAGLNQLVKNLIKEFGGRVAFSIDNKALESLPTKGHKDFSSFYTQHTHYLADIGNAIRNYYKKASTEWKTAEKAYAIKETLAALKSESGTKGSTVSNLKKLYQKYYGRLSKESKRFLKEWPSIQKKYNSDEITYQVHDKDFKVKTKLESICGSPISRVALPRYSSWGELLKFYYKENLPGYFPFTGGVFPFKRTDEEPRRQFAGEGTPENTNKRFRYLTKVQEFKRLSVAFDGVTLYGENPTTAPDVYGKTGESGVNICTIKNMEALFRGINLSDPKTSVSMTINGPAPIILAMFFMTAYRQEVKRKGQELNSKEKIALFQELRGTVQADILKEDQAQNSCIFSIDFALKMMGDVQTYFVKHKIHNYYPISISGYHIAEAGANPITQLAFTLANGFYYVEYFKSLGLDVDDFVQHFSFFFSNGMDPEYSVIGRVARRIWAIAMCKHHGASANAQKLKYHIQTSGRSLHAQEIDFNDIRTTLQALFAFYDNCNSLHTNSYDEAVTTPTKESVHRSIAIQLILSKEFGLLKNENPNQGSFIIEELTDLVEEAVLEEFKRISYRGGVLGAMEKQYHRSKIQEESLYYEELKHTGAYPIIGVNTFVTKDGTNAYDRMDVRRATKAEKEQQLNCLKKFEMKNHQKAKVALETLRDTALSGGNIFEELLNTVQYASLGQITNLLYEVGGKYRRNT